MKKFLVAVMLFCAMGSIAWSQQKCEKPEKGSFSAEIQVNPFDQNGRTFSIDGIKLRYFLNEKNALRLNVDFSGHSEKYSYTPEEEEYSYLSELKSRYKNLEINLGYERHFGVGTRFDFYAGGEVGLTRYFAKTTGKMMHDGTGSDITISNAYLPQSAMPDGIPSLGTLSSAIPANIGFRVAALAGVDVYLYKGLYIGTELNFSIKHVKTKQVEATFMDYTSNEEITIKTEDESKNTDFGFHIEPYVRLGWTF